MTDYRTLTEEEKKRVEKLMVEHEPYHPEWVRDGSVCCYCYQPSHTCLCSHDD